MFVLVSPASRPCTSSEGGFGGRGEGEGGRATEGGVVLFHADYCLSVFDF